MKKYSLFRGLLLAVCVSTAAMPLTAGRTDADTLRTRDDATSARELLIPKADTPETTYDRENGVLPIADNRGFTLQSKDGRFVFKPYMFIQTTLGLHYYDDEGLDKAYNQDNIANSGFAIPYGIIGFTGRAFGCIDYNVSINAAASGGAILQQAWLDYAVSPAIRFRVGKFKTPFAHAYLTTLGETLFPTLPTSLTASVILPYSLNAVTPNIGTGFDLGFEMHGLVKDRFGYEVGIFNGTGAGVNNATKGFSDDNHFPSLLYTGRLTYQPFGAMPATQGSPKLLNQKKALFGISASFNNEAASESTNELRMGLEAAALLGRWYVAGEAYWMHMGFTKRQKIDEKYNYWGAYAQVGYFVTPSWQLGLRYDWFNRNGSSKDGSLNAPAVVCNFYVPKTNLKVSGMYQFNGRWGHKTQLDRDLDDLGIPTHSAMLMLQYAF